MTLIVLFLTILISLSDKNFLNAVKYGNEDYVCQTEDGRRGVDGIDFKKKDLNNEQCEDECTKKPWCEAIEIKKGTRYCKLWYDKPPTLESKDGYLCKHKLYDDYDEFFSPPRLSRCKEGQENGYDEANFLMWKKFDDDCDNLFEFAEKASGDLLEDKFAGLGEYNKCSRNGVKNSIDEWYEKCLNPAECNEYGVLAAELVINSFCQLKTKNAKIHEPKKIKKECKAAARRTCRGYLYSALEDLVIFGGYSCPKMDDYDNYADELREDCGVMVRDLMET